MDFGKITYLINSSSRVNNNLNNAELKREFGDSAYFFFNKGFTKLLNFGSDNLEFEIFSPMEKKHYTKHRGIDTLYIIQSSSSILQRIDIKEESEKILNFRTKVLEAQFFDTLGNFSYKIRHHYNSEFMPMSENYYEWVDLDGLSKINQIKGAYSLKIDFEFDHFYVSMCAVDGSIQKLDIEAELNHYKSVFPILIM